MSCQHIPQQPTPNLLLMEAHDAFARLTPPAGKQIVTNAYLDFRNALFDVMTIDGDASEYDVSWATIKGRADSQIAALQELPEGSMEYARALEQLQHEVSMSYDHTPWKG